MPPEAAQGAQTACRELSLSQSGCKASFSSHALGPACGEGQCRLTCWDLSSYRTKSCPWGSGHCPRWSGFCWI